jgi:hypothetical protein
MTSQYLDKVRYRISHPSITVMKSPYHGMYAGNIIGVGNITF